MPYLQVGVLLYSAAEQQYESLSKDIMESSDTERACMGVSGCVSNVACENLFLVSPANLSCFFTPTCILFHSLLLGFLYLKHVQLQG